ncbi:Cdc6/Cdc18 family protein [Halococcoides cellulosivorans]|uniref:AAA family ATPase n=1 Tax=Halococcoides cellulosivorans TaxID=1679096 RepID=A0A2R4X326_9EURY|nr:Cdc6/Cdc18 family protein [Halococcoides cellulosivorans]AWB28197.1 AAA family ATPase [Halococcoides cellulosivorans]
MITDARVLTAQFVPRDVEHRHEEIDRLSTALDPLLDDQPGENASLFGPTGAGKTCVARYTLRQLREQLPGLDAQYVNCWRDGSPFAVRRRLLDAVGDTTDVHRQSTAIDALRERFRGALDGPFVAVLDEVDQLSSTDLLYDLNATPEVTLVLIANREAELFADLDDRLDSRLRGGVTVNFDRYGVDELGAILASRAERGLDPGAIDERGLRTIADRAGGDARVAIDALRAAARAAERRGGDRIADRDLADAVPTARSTIRERRLETLGEHQRAVYAAIREAGEIAPGPLYDAYSARVAEPRSRRMMRNYCAKLDQYGLIRAEGETRDRRYSVVEV